MGGLNIFKMFSAPKVPAPQVIQAPTLDTTDSQAALLEERKRRNNATGSTGNIVSSLVGASPDIQTATKKSTLLGG